MHPVPLRAQVTSRLPGCEMRFRSRSPSKSEGLGLLFDALGGTTAVARLLGRDPSTVAKWRTGALPIPAGIATVLREEAMRIASSLQNEAFRLKFDEIPRAEQRAAHGLAWRRQAFFRRFGGWPHGDPVRQERMRARQHDGFYGGREGRR
jgi:DNA-binding transcriptional regulator YdaS (Cro superfamily)